MGPVLLNEQGTGHREQAAGKGGFTATHKLHVSRIKKDTLDGMRRAHGQDKAHALDLCCEGGNGWHVRVTNLQGAWKEQLSQKR